MTDRLRIAIGAGHRHTLGEQGNAFEKELNGRKVHAIMEAWRQSPGFQEWAEIRSYTPNDGLGLYPGYLNEAPASLVLGGWRPDVMVELHSEGTGSSAVRGSFVIYPDWTPDTDHAVRDFGQLLCDELFERTGIPLRPQGYLAAPGIMSERQTGVGMQGYRLGVFRSTVAARSWCTRLIFEQGAHTNAKDRAIMTSPDFLNKQAQAFWFGMREFAIATRMPFDAPAQAVKPMDVPTGGKIGDLYQFGNATWRRVKAYNVSIPSGAWFYAGFRNPSADRIPAFQLDTDGGHSVTRRVTFEQYGGPYLVVSGGWMVRENEVTKEGPGHGE